MFKSHVFKAWYFSALALWAVLFATFDSVQFLVHQWYYPVMMVGGAFVAGFTPEGGGAVAFPVLNVFLHVDRVLARDFSIMIQSVGMTSASIFILSDADTRLSDYRPLLTFVPVCFVGFLLGMSNLQQIPAFIIQALFLSLSATFVIAYYFSSHRGTATTLVSSSTLERAFLVFTLVVGGMVTSLFGTGADVLVYLVLVTHFNMTAKKATRMVVILQAAMSVLGYGYRGFVDHGLTSYQIRTWLCAYPVVLFMAPFGAYALSRLHVNWMLRLIIAVNVFQLLYFNCSEPSRNKTAASVIFTVSLAALFYWLLRHMSRRDFKASNVPGSTLPTPEI
jgi:uncharacterized membrane protein YfcA